MKIVVIGGAGRISERPSGRSRDDRSRIHGIEIIPRAKLMEVVKTVRLGMVPRAGVEPARPCGQRILSPVDGILPDLTKRDEPIFTGPAAVKVMLRLATYRNKMSSS